VEEKEGPWSISGGIMYRAGKYGFA